MPWSTSDRREQLPSDWHARRARTYRVAGGRCEWVTDGHRCAYTGPLNKTAGRPGMHVDHKDRTKGHEQANLQLLCPPHHLAKSSTEGQYAMRQLRGSAYHRIEKHPGFID